MFPTLLALGGIELSCQDLVRCQKLVERDFAFDQLNSQ